MPQQKTSTQDFGESRYCNGGQIGTVASDRGTQPLPLPLPKPKTIDSVLALGLPACIANSKQPMGLSVWSNTTQYTRLKNRSGKINQESTVRLT